MHNALTLYRVEVRRSAGVNLYSSRVVAALNKTAARNIAIEVTRQRLGLPSSVALFAEVV